MNMIVEPAEMKRYSGAERAAAMMLILGKEHGAPIWETLSTDEIKDLSATIAMLGKVPASVADFLLVSFSNDVAGMNSLQGTFETTERLLDGILPEDRVKEIMNEIRGPAGRTMWDKLSNVSETVLAGYLKNEYPQTVAVILSKLKPDHAARVLSQLPSEVGIDVVQRMLRMETVQKDVLVQVEHTLRNEFMSNLSRSQRRDPHESMAEVFNAMDRSTEEMMLNALDASAPESAERIRSLMFTFEDLGTLMPSAISAIVRQADKRQLALALKGASQDIVQLFIGALTERAGKLLRDDMASMGPVRARDCDEAQSALVRLAKALADSGEIVLADPKSDDAMIL